MLYTTTVKSNKETKNKVNIFKTFKSQGHFADSFHKIILKLQILNSNINHIVNEANQNLQLMYRGQRYVYVLP